MNKLVYVTTLVTKNDEVIITLENFGGINKNNLTGNATHHLYYISLNSRAIHLMAHTKDNEELLQLAGYTQVRKL